MSQRTVSKFLVLLVVVGGASGCTKEKPKVFAPQPPVTREDGLTWQVLAAGDGDVAKRGDKITIHFVGTLEDGGVFDSTRARRQAFSFWVGEGQIVEGLDDALLGMREGEVRRVTVPAKLGYGGVEKPNIPANSVLNFEVELVDVR